MDKYENETSNRERPPYSHEESGGGIFVQSKRESPSKRKINGNTGVYRVLIRGET